MVRNAGSLIFAAALALSAPPGTAQAQVNDDSVSMMSNDDPMMRKAFKRARAELDAFLKTARAPADHQSDFAVKVGLQEGERTEYVWISDFKEDARGNLSGVINNEIEIARKYKLGDTYRFTREDIVDWLYFDAHEVRMYGNYTMCALLTQEPAEQAARTIAQYKLDCAL
jgi:uncharacterized protein YegJ (DUF2314 family)